MKVIFIRNVYPGDKIEENGIKSFGIHENKATIVGQLCRVEDVYFIRSKTGKYSPMKYDVVMGKVVYVSSDYYRIDLGNVYGFLPALAFVNASKKNRPDLQKGDFVLCQVTGYGSELLLTCNQNGLGGINEVHSIEPWKVRSLYFSDFLRQIGSNENFKIAMGMNGYLWIDGEARVKAKILKALREWMP